MRLLKGKGKYDGAYLFEDDDGTRIFIEDPDKAWRFIYFVKKIIKSRRKYSRRQNGIN